MNKNIIIVGSTGKLGTKLLKYTYSNNIKINAITCYSNNTKLLIQKSKYKIKKGFMLSDDYQKLQFIKFLEKKSAIIYFLDYGAYSLIYLDIFLKFNSNSIIAIANKEMIIAGGKLLFKKINLSKNYFIPLDSEHFSLKNSLSYNSNINKIYITASGGPFFFSKKSNFTNVKLNEVLAHPKWKMGKNNSIDSSNFINKILEIFELSYIFNIDLSKIDFLVSKNAYVHSIIMYNDGITTLNCYKNDMLIPLIYPLTYIKKINPNIANNQYLLNQNNFSLINNFDKRFIFFKYHDFMKKLNHINQLNLLLLNNYAHSLYLSDKLKYKDIIPFIMNKLFKLQNKYKRKNFFSFKQILNHIEDFKNNYLV